MSLTNHCLNYVMIHKNSCARSGVKALNCLPVEQQQQQVWNVECSCCSGRGWMVCEFCKGQKSNVRSPETNRIYRRCPNCRAIGSTICSKCKVYRCVTFPDLNDAPPN